MKLLKMFPVLTMLLIVLVTGCKKDDDPAIRPTVISTDPLTDATNRGIGEKISATFSVAMDPSTITSSSFTLKQGTVSVAGEVSYTGTTASFTPTAALAPNAVHTATITTASQNVSGTSLAEDMIWSFTTGALPDTSLPTVTLTDPANNATGVTLNKAVVVTFSEAMDQTTITALTFTIMQGSTSIAGTVTKTGTTGTFTPASNLEYSKIYTVTISTGAKDVAGNALATTYTSSFTTGAAPDTTVPTVLSTDPLNNAISVASNKMVTIAFSEAMTASTINATTFTLNQGTTAVTGVVAYTETTATFTPATALAANTAYTATITTGAKDVAGNALATATVWSFTTAGPSSNLAPVDLGAAANYVILAKAAVNNNPTSAITGDIGLSPAATSFITGFALTNATGLATSPQVTGNLYAADMADPTPINLTTAVNNMITAYNDAAGRPSPDFSELATGNIGGRTLTGGLYKWSNTVTLPSDVTISGGANDVWIFQIAGDLTISNAVNMTLIGGAQPKNIFWQVAGTVTIGTTAHFEGVILSQTGITFQTGASFKGRALAQTVVILDGNAITMP
ncbi:MAG: DUF3494 domain-containing protein [Bacteroidia bacterium]|nr:DUF3494 domain-containing protein [Bacteroidia bacterium]